LTAWDARNPADSRGHFGHLWRWRCKGGSDEPATMMSLPGAPLVGLTRGVADWLSAPA
jgi:hypothetical protein